jgi:hypothetical protein
MLGTNSPISISTTTTTTTTTSIFLKTADSQCKRLYQNGSFCRVSLKSLTVFLKVRYIYLK